MAREINMNITPDIGSFHSPVMSVHDSYIGDGSGADSVVMPINKYKHTTAIREYTTNATHWATWDYVIPGEFTGPKLYFRINLFFRETSSLPIT